MAYIGAPLVSTNFVLDQFTATSGQTAFTLSRAPASAQSIIVMIDGAIQEPNQAYTISGVTLTTTAGVGLNNRVAVIHLGVAGVLTTPADGSVTSPKLALTTVTNSLAADVNLTNAALYFDGPSVAQGSAGTWYASGTVTFIDPAGSANIFAKLWDGTNVVASATTQVPSNQQYTMSLSGFFTSPPGNIRISVRNSTRTGTGILFNLSGNSKDSTISAMRIG